MSPHPEVVIASLRSLRTVALVTALVAGVAAAAPVSGTEIEGLRARAQEVADEVTRLERTLAALDAREGAIRSRIAALETDIAALRASAAEAVEEQRRARRRVVSQAVELYKSGSTAGLAMLLDSATLSQGVRVARAMSEVAERRTVAVTRYGRLHHLVRALSSRLQDRMNRLEAMLDSVRRLRSTTMQTVARRRASLARLQDDIDALAEQLHAAVPGVVLPTSAMLGPATRGDLARYGLVSAGVSFGGNASWYGDEFAGRPTASGQPFDPDLYTAASRDLRLGTLLYVTRAGRGVVVLVNDRGPFHGGRVLDLSRAAARSLGIAGVGWITAEVLLRR